MYGRRVAQIEQLQGLALHLGFPIVTTRLRRTWVRVMVNFCLADVFVYIFGRGVEE